MKKITIFYLFLFITHIILGPYYIYDLIRLKEPSYRSKTIEEVVRRSFWLTYISFLSLALFNEYPTSETFLIALMLSLISTIGYYYKFVGISEVFYIGIMDHVLYLCIPVFYLYFYYRIKISKYIPTYLTLIAAIYIVSYKYIDQILYPTGNDM